jgi:hypothetical protein
MSTLIPKYDQGGTNFYGSAVNRPFNQKLQETISVKDFGAVGDGTTDDTNAIKAAIVAANGATVFFPVGHYRITSSLDSGLSVNVYLKGITPANSAVIINFAYNNSSDFSPASIDNLSSLITEYSVIKCDGCNLIGSVDTGTINASTNFRQLSNMIVYGTNNALTGIYMSSTDTLIENSTILLFQYFGLMMRGGETTSIINCVFADNGWNLTNSGTVAAPIGNVTYVSGCQIITVANNTPGNYYQVVNGYQATTTSLVNVFNYVRGYQVANFSGYRGMQLNGALGFSLNNVGTYSCNYFNQCQLDCTALYVESYSYHGLTTLDQIPSCLYIVASQLQLNAAYLKQLTSLPVETPSIFTYVEAGQFMQNTIANIGYKFNKTINGATTNSLTVSPIAVTSPGTTQYYPIFPYAVPDETGFHGLVFVTVRKVSDPSKYASATFLISKFNTIPGTGGVVNQPPATINIYDVNTNPYNVTITQCDLDGNGNLVLGITWGSGYSSSEYFFVDAGLIGNELAGYGFVYR